MQPQIENYHSIEFNSSEFLHLLASLGTLTTEELKNHPHYETWAPK